MFGLFDRYSVIGLDIGNYSIKLALSNRNGKQVYYLWKELAFPGRENRDQAVTSEEMHPVLSKIRKNLQDIYPGVGNDVNTVIQGEGTMGRYLEFPSLSSRELETAARSKALQSIPFPPENVNLDYLVVPPLDKKDDKSAVFFVAARKDKVEELSGIIKNAGFHVQRVEIPMLPLLRDFNANHQCAAGEFYMLVSAGFTFTHIIIIRDGSPYYLRELSLGGRDLTYLFQMGDQISWGEAMETKLRYDVDKNDPMVMPLITNWFSQIKRSLDHFKKQAPVDSFKLSKVYLSGGSSALTGLGRGLSEYLGVTVELDGWDRIKYSGKYNIPDPYTYNTAIGLSLEK